MLLTRPLTRVVTATLLVAVTLVHSGCASSTPASQETAEPVAAHLAPDLDPATGSIVLPVERYMASESEQREVYDAISRTVSECAAEAGVALPFRPVVPEIGGSRLYGVWVEAYATQFGYALPESPEKAAALERNADPGAAPTSEQLQVIQACNASDEVDRLVLPAASLPPSVADALAGADDVLSGDAARRVFAEWEACLATHGLRRDPSISPYAILGTSTEITEANIVTAVRDVRCKDEVDFVPRLARLEAEAMAPVLDAHVVELATMRQEIETVLERARQVNAAHG